MLMQVARSGQRNRCLEVICLPQVREKSEAVAEVRVVKPEIGRQCFNCGKTGHLARDCEVAKKCTRCGKVGHNSRNCELTPRCFNCGKVGHSTRNCFHRKRLAAISHEQRNVGRGFRKRIFSRIVRNVSTEMRELDLTVMKLV